ncbi:MAG: winged helix-turn-helix domain-containing protein [Microbispora sp.]|nr:winged helix-turn-helix domain-containing protein [Microbispora sp.]
MGRFTAQIHGHTIHRWNAGKARNLFQYLVLNRGHVVPKERLKSVLWTGDESSSNSSSLKVAVHAVRKTLNRVQGGQEAVSIVHCDEGYLLRASDLWVDVEEFEELIDRGKTAVMARKTAAARAAYTQAMALYRGDFLAGENADWIIEQREWCRALALPALIWLAEDALRRGDHCDVIHWSRRAVDLDPYREETYQLMMVMHSMDGNLGAVRSWYRMCEQRLSKDLGIPPNEHTERIYSEALGRGRSDRLLATADRWGLSRAATATAPARSRLAPIRKASR